MAIASEERIKKFKVQLIITDELTGIKRTVAYNVSELKIKNAAETGNGYFDHFIQEIMHAVKELLVIEIKRILRF